MKPGRPAHVLLVVLGAFLFVAGVDLFTGSLPPLWDGATYVSMAEHGVYRNPDATAPFIYRPGMPFLAGAAARALDVSTVTGFRMVGFASAVLLLILVYGLALGVLRDPGGAAFIAAAVGLTATHVKFPLYYDTLVDVAAYPWMVLAVWMCLYRRYRTALAVSLLGLLFKEFLIIPVLLLALRAWNDPALSLSRKRVWVFAAGALGLLVFLLPRILVPVKTTYQEIDPVHDLSSLKLLVENPLSWKRDVNIGFALAGYWLPTWLLLTPGRARALWKELEPIRVWLGVYLAAVLLLTLYGGTNIFVFVSYAVGAQVLVLAYLLRQGIPRTELVLVLAALFFYNRILWNLPDPAVDFNAYVDFYGGWATRLPRESGYRVLEMAGYALAMLAVRRLPSRPRLSPGKGTPDR